MNILSSPTQRSCLALFLFLVLVYAVFPTRNHYWDGIGFALNIEGLPQDAKGFVLDPQSAAALPRIYFNPNHLLHNLLGWLLYAPLRGAFPSLRAHDVLVTLSVLLNSGTCCLVFLLLRRWTGNWEYSLWPALLMAFSATFWKFSTDVDTYGPPVFLLTLAGFWLTTARRARWLMAAALAHALAMLLHQIAIFFLPAALFAVWRRDPRWQACARYLAFAGIPVACAYVLVWTMVLHGTLAPADFIAWLTSNGADVLSNRSAAGNLAESLRSLVRLFFGGKLRHAAQFVGQPMLWLLAPLLLLAIAQTFREIWRLWRQPAPAAGPRPEHRRFLTLWIAGFLVFLSVWLTEYPYYRLFCLPALALWVGVSLSQRTLPALRAFVISMTLANFLFYIYPYSKTEATPPVHLAMNAGAVWNAKELVLFQDFTCDNWIMKHFNPRTVWRQMPAGPDEISALAGILAAAQAESHTVWLDTTFFAMLLKSPETLAWVQSRFHLSEPWGISTEKHHIQFVRLTAIDELP